MAHPLTKWQQQVAADWLTVQEGNSPPELLNDRCFTLAEQRLQELLSATSSGTPPTVLLTERDPVRFLAGFIAARAADWSIFLGNPNWVKSEWQQVLALTQPDLIWGRAPEEMHSFVSCDKPIAHGAILIPTGGSSGQIRFAIHTWETLMAAVQAFQHYFQREQINACCVLPLYHVSGLMQFLRSITSGGKLAIVPFKRLEAGILPAIDPSEFFISLVPTQLQRLLQQAATIDWLRQFPTVLLGGAPAWSDLLEQARQQQIRLAPTYGMTETAAQIVTLKPEEFLRGNNSSGRVLPHAEVRIGDRSHAVTGKVGRLTIQSQSLALGYYLDRRFPPQGLCVDDVGFFDAQGCLHIVGRSSQKIITGGENVFPAEVEAAIRSTGLVRDVCVVGLPDRDWGERVTAVYVPVAADVAVASLQQAIEHRLSKFKRPKRWIAANQLPRNAQGKINAEQLKQSLLSVD